MARSGSGRNPGRTHWRVHPGTLLPYRQVEGVESSRMKSETVRNDLIPGSRPTCAPAFMSGRHTRVTSSYDCQYNGRRALSFNLPHLADMVCLGARGEAPPCSTRTERLQSLPDS